jgi:ferredoxin-NADP reductase
MTPRTRLVTVGDVAADFTFHAGQAVWLRRLGHQDRKPYSIASAPADLQKYRSLDFLVALEDEGEPGPQLGDVDIGSVIEMEGPLGGFDLPKSVPSAPVLLIAGGTGIAPLRSMWRELLAHHDATLVSVIYSARSSQELAFLSELRDLERQARIRLVVTVTGSDESWSGDRGRLSENPIAELLTSPADARCAVCGPASFVATVSKILLRLGVPPAHVATERW